MDDKDAGYLERAFDLAEKGRGRTSPNPIVGAVIVRDGDAIGEGWHAGPGCDHAEVAAIKDAVARSGARRHPADAAVETRRICAGSTIYVTLEPCCTQGRTPPCTSALVAGGFARVVAGAIDPTPQVNGKSLELLRTAGIQVELAEGSLAHRMKRQNDGQRKAVTKGLPFVTYKYAMTLDGRVAADSGDSRWVSSTESRALVHQWRAWSDAVVVGAGTAAADDPQLTARNMECARQPLRVVIDTGLTLPRTSRLVETLADGPVVVVCGTGVGDDRRAEVGSWGVETAEVACGADGEVDPMEACRLLVSRDVQTVLLEGGPQLAGAWWAAGLVDRVAAFVCPKIVSGQEHRGPLRGPGARSMEQAARLLEVDVRRVGPDLLIVGYLGGPF